MLVNEARCLKNIMLWMTSNFLLLNSGRTEVTVLVPQYLRNRVLFYQDMSTLSHKKKTPTTAFFHLCNIKNQVQKDRKK